MKHSTKLFNNLTPQTEHYRAFLANAVIHSTICETPLQSDENNFTQVLSLFSYLSKMSAALTENP